MPPRKARLMIYGLIEIRSQPRYQRTMSEEAGGAESGAGQFAVDKPSDSPWGSTLMLSHAALSGKICGQSTNRTCLRPFPYPRTLVCRREWDAGEANLFGP